MPILPVCCSHTQPTSKMSAHLLIYEIMTRGQWPELIAGSLVVAKNDCPNIRPILLLELPPALLRSEIQQQP